MAVLQGATSRRVSDLKSDSSGTITSVALGTTFSAIRRFSIIPIGEHSRTSQYIRRAFVAPRQFSLERNPIPCQPLALPGLRLLRMGLAHWLGWPGLARLSTNIRRNAVPVRALSYQVRNGYGASDEVRCHEGTQQPEQDGDCDERLTSSQRVDLPARDSTTLYSYPSLRSAQLHFLCMKLTMAASSGADMGEAPISASPAEATVTTAAGADGGAY